MSCLLGCLYCYLALLVVLVRPYCSMPAPNSLQELVQQQVAWALELDACRSPAALNVLISTHGCIRPINTSASSAHAAFAAACPERGQF